MTNDLRAKVPRDPVKLDDWRVEKMDANGGYETVKVFTGSGARDRAIVFTRQRFGEFDEIELDPYPYKAE
jgi:hypothetical protein